MLKGVKAVAFGVFFGVLVQAAPCCIPEGKNVCDAQSYIDIGCTKDFLCGNVSKAEIASHCCSGQMDLVNGVFICQGAPADPCTDDLAQAGVDVGHAVIQLVDAVAKCTANIKSSDCLEAISNSLIDVAAAGDSVNKAVGDCGGQSLQCVTDISKVNVDLGTILDKITHALSDCPAGKWFACIDDVADAAKSAVLLAGDIKTAITDCTPHSFELAAPQDQCTDDLAQAGVQVGQAVIQLVSTVQVCGKGIKSLDCLDAISTSLTDVALAGDSVNKAVGDCGGHSVQCVTDLSQVNTALGAILKNVEQALTDCPAGKWFNCIDDISDAAKGIVTVVGDIQTTITDCKPQKALELAAPADQCNDDLAAAGVQVGQAVIQLISTVDACSKAPKSLDCINDISASLADLAAAGDSVNKAVGDCGGSSVQCVTDISQVNIALSGIIAQVSKALQDCPGGKWFNCIDDVANAAKGIVIVVGDVQTAIGDCKPKSFELAAPQDQCTDDLADAGVQVGQAVIQLISTVQACTKGITSSECINDIAASLDDLALAGDSVNKAVGDCGGHSIQCVTDLSAVNKDLSGVITQASKALHDCPASQWFACIDDVSGAAKGIVTVVGDVQTAIADCKP